MKNINIYKNINLFVPNSYYQNIKDELDQITILSTLLDIELQKITFDDNYKNILEITLDRLVLLLKSKKEKIIYVELYSKNNTNYTCNVIYYYDIIVNNKTNPYSTLLNSLQYLKNAL